MHRQKPLTRSELGANDLGALGRSRQGHCQGWDGDLDWGEGRTPIGVRVSMEVRRLPLHVNAAGKWA